MEFSRIRFLRLQYEMSNISMESGSGGEKETESWDDYKVAKFTVLVDAEKALQRLQNGVPRFVKCMLSSNVESGFWMPFPRNFCRLYLPNHNSRIVLVDEWGVKYETCFKLEKYSLSAGWRRFSASHKLKKDDILIFQLIETCKIKVYIVRIHDPKEISTAILLMNIGGSWPETKEGEYPAKIIETKQRALMNVSFWIDNYRPTENNRRCTKRYCQLC